MRLLASVVIISWFEGSKAMQVMVWLVSFSTKAPAELPF